MAAPHNTRIDEIDEEIREWERKMEEVEEDHKQRQEVSGGEWELIIVTTITTHFIMIRRMSNRKRSWKRWRRVSKKRKMKRRRRF